MPFLLGMKSCRMHFFAISARHGRAAGHMPIAHPQPLAIALDGLLIFRSIALPLLESTRINFPLPIFVMIFRFSPQPDRSWRNQDASFPA